MCGRCCITPPAPRSAAARCGVNPTGTTAASASAIVEPDGSYLVVWQSFSGGVAQGIESRRISATGVPSASTTSVAAGAGLTLPSVAIDPTSGQTIVTWQQTVAGVSSVLAQFYTPDGSDLGAPLLPTPDVVAPAGVERLTAAASSTGLFGVMWSTGGSVSFQRFQFDQAPTVTTTGSIPVDARRRTKHAGQSVQLLQRPRSAAQ